MSGSTSFGILGAGLQPGWTWEEARALGFRYARMFLNWSTFEPEAGHFDDKRIQLLADSARLLDKAGIRMVLTFGLIPSWARSTAAPRFQRVTHGPVEDPDMQTAVLERVLRRPEITAVLDALIFRNEPEFHYLTGDDIRTWWNGPARVDLWWRELDLTREVVRRVAPSVRVVPNLLYETVEGHPFSLRALLADGLGRRADGLDIHLYPGRDPLGPVGRVPPLARPGVKREWVWDHPTSRLRALRGLLDGTALASAPLTASEAGVLVDPGSPWADHLEAAGGLPARLVDWSRAARGLAPDVLIFHVYVPTRGGRTAQIPRCADCGSLTGDPVRDLYVEYRGVDGATHALRLTGALAQLMEALARYAVTPAGVTSAAVRVNGGSLEIVDCVRDASLQNVPLSLIDGIDDLGFDAFARQYFKRSLAEVVEWEFTPNDVDH